MHSAIVDLDPDDVLAGTSYRLLRRVGVGGMGAVYECEHTRLHRRTCVKVVHPGLSGRRDLLDRMEVEARALARLDHPSIVRIFDMGVTDAGLPYFAMEMLHGRDLRSLLRTQKRLTLEDALAIAKDVLDALAHAHREGIVHRDIKPENVFVSPLGAGTVAKVLDFGIAHVASDPRGLTGNRFIGTSAYAAPEQLRGEPPSEKTDVYAVGCLLFELITGTKPFAGPSMSDYYRQHVYEPAPRLSERTPVPRDLDDLCASALAKNPDARPVTALWFAAQLQRIGRKAPRTARVDPDATTESLLTSLGSRLGDSSPAWPRLRRPTARRDTSTGLAGRQTRAKETALLPTVAQPGVTSSARTSAALMATSDTGAARLVTERPPKQRTIRLPPIAALAHSEPTTGRSYHDRAGRAPGASSARYGAYLVAMLAGIALALVGALGWSRL